MEKFGMNECNPFKVPTEPMPSSHYKFTKKDPVSNPSSTAYRSLISGLMYIMGMTRPDIAFAVIAASRYWEDTCKPHWRAAKHVLAYLSGTRRFGLRYSASESVNLLASFD